MRSRINSTLSVFGAGLLLLTLSGCGYYEITDPQTKNVYYAKQAPFTIRRIPFSGAIEFVDAATGKTVTLQNTEIRTVDTQTAIQDSGGKISN